MRPFVPWIVVALASLFASCGDSGGASSAGAAAYPLGGPSANAQGGFDYDLTIAFTNDLHDQVLPIANGRGGLARQATLMNLLRAQAAARGKAILAVNAGDNFEGTLFYDTDGGATLLRLLEAIGYDVVQIGNHDHQFGAQRLYDRLAAAFPGFSQRLKLLWGNVNPSHMSAIGTDPALSGAAFTPAQVDQAVIDAFENAFDDFAAGTVDFALMDPPTANSKLFNQTVMLVVNGIRIGLFGLDTDEALYSSVPGEGDLFLDPGGKSENLRFYEPATHTFASDMITYFDDPDLNPATDDGADVIIAVTHTGFAVDQQIAANAVGASGRRIDVIVGGHSHTRLNTAVTVTHAGGRTTTIVQAGSRGEFVGRLDLSVDPAANAVTVRNAELLQVDARLPSDPLAAALISGELTRAGGVDDTHGTPFSTVIAQSDVFLPGGLPSTSSLGNLAVDAVRSAANAPPHQLNLDIVLLGNFVFRSDISIGPVTIGDAHATLPLHVLDRNGTTMDGIDVIQFRPGPRLAIDPSTFPVPGFLNGITELEYFLELAFGINDVLASLGSFLGFSIDGIDDFIQGLQWSGVVFEVDPAAQAMHRIDPASIFIGGQPLVGNENTIWRLGLSSLLARVAVPFFQLLTQVEEPAGTSNFVPFPEYDPLTAATALVTWEALRDSLQQLGQLSVAATRVGGDRPRTRGPDLTFEPTDAVFAPMLLTRGGAATLTMPLANLGASGAVDAIWRLELDRTPEFGNDDPDGVTDLLTGANFALLGTGATGPVPGFFGGTPGTAVLSVAFTVPVDATPGAALLFLTITGVQSAVGGTAETVTANNGGVLLPIRATIQ